MRDYLNFINFNSTKLSPTFGWYVRYLQSIDKFDLFGELIYREGFTVSDGSKVSQSYNLNTGIIYHHSPNLSIKLKGENLLNSSPKSVFPPIPSMLPASVFNAYDRKILVTIKRYFYMKLLRVLLFLLIPAIPAFSQHNSDYIEVRLIEKILTDMANKRPVNVCVINYDVNKILNYSTCFRITKCENADFMIIGKDSKEINHNKPAIVFGEDLIKKVYNAVGALYWKKGRPQLIFIKSRLDKYKIQLPSKYKGYLVDESVLSKMLDSSNFKNTYLVWER